MVSVKAVVLDGSGRVLLVLNDRGEWEHPGGQLEEGESPQSAVRREVFEESRLEVTVGPLIRAWVFEPLPRTPVLILSYGCTLTSGQLRQSAEHDSIAFQQPGELESLNLPLDYRTDIEIWMQSR